MGLADISRRDYTPPAAVCTQTAASSPFVWFPHAWRLSVDKILIVGLDTIAGANFAAALKDRHEITGVCCETQVSVAGCDSEPSVGDDPAAAVQLLQRLRPDWAIYCGPNSQWGWEPKPRTSHEAQLLRSAKAWADALGRAKIPTTVISSASVFTGPWMFHDEDSTQFCTSTAARAILTAEREFQNRLANPLIVRTHLFGWSPLGEEDGFAASLLNRLRIGETSPIDCVRHAGPILATDLAEILLQTRAAELTGTIHIGGAERINPWRFATLLADQFGYPCTVCGTLDPVGERSAQFGAGESSLNCRRIRQELAIGLPLATEGIERFHAQALGDFRDQFQIQGRPTRNLVA